MPSFAISSTRQPKTWTQPRLKRSAKSGRRRTRRKLTVCAADAAGTGLSDGCTPWGAPLRHHAPGLMQLRFRGRPIRRHPVLAPWSAKGGVPSIAAGWILNPSSGMRLMKKKWAAAAARRWRWPGLIMGRAAEGAA